MRKTGYNFAKGREILYFEVRGMRGKEKCEIMTRDKKERWVRICPKCGSKDVEARGMVWDLAYSQTWVCRTCGFQGSLFPEVKEDEALNIPEKLPKFNPSRMPIVPGKPNKLFRVISYLIVIFIILALILLLLKFVNLL